MQCNPGRDHSGMKWHKNVISSFQHISIDRDKTNIVVSEKKGKRVI